MLCRPSSSVYGSFGWAESTRTGGILIDLDQRNAGCLVCSPGDIVESGPDVIIGPPSLS